MRTILIQLDTDPQPSVFDRVVAVDAGVDELFSYGGITPENAEPLVHGGMFTRGPQDLKSTAVFVGGSDVAAGQALFERVRKTFFGPVRLSVMLDSNGSNTTAAAAVLSAKKHLDLSGTEALVLGGTGPVGRRVAQLLALEGALVRVGSRSAERAAAVCEAVRAEVSGGELKPVATRDAAATQAALDRAALVVAAGALGVQLVTAEQRRSASDLQVAIDLNAVPPTGLEGVEVMDKATDRDGVICYGAIGVGGLKMKIHKAALKKLFTANDLVLDTEAVYRIGEEMLAAG